MRKKRAIIYGWRREQSLIRRCWLIYTPTQRETNAQTERITHHVFYSCRKLFNTSQINITFKFNLKIKVIFDVWF